MDSHARLVLEEVARGALHADLDQLSTEIETLRETVTMLERATGLDSTRLAPDARRERITALRERGLSTSMIAAVLSVGRDTVAKDLRVMKLPPPAATVGRDGVTRRYHSHSPANGSQPAG